MYKAILFSPEGNWVTDYRGRKTVQEVIDAIADQGSRWFFYPFAFVIKDHGPITQVTQRIVDAPDELKHLERKTIDKVADWIENNDLSYLS